MLIKENHQCRVYVGDTASEVISIILQHIQEGYITGFHKIEIEPDREYRVYSGRVWVKVRES